MHGCHPSLLATLRGGNVNVQVLYCLPFVFVRDVWMDVNAKAAHGHCVGRSAPSGRANRLYCSDFCAKNQEFQKGHVALMGAYARRMSDAYCKGNCSRTSRRLQPACQPYIRGQMAFVCRMQMAFQDANGLRVQYIATYSV